MPAQTRSFAWKAASILAGYCVIFYWKILFTDSVMFPWDAADYFYPTLAFVHEELRHLRLPLWDPYILSGYPIIGDIQAQIFYPLNWLYLLLSPASPLPYRFVEIQQVVHFLLAGLFMYLLARELVESETAALLAGLLFMASGGMVARTQHVNAMAMAWSPLIFLLARRGLLRRELLYSVGAGMLFGVQLLAGRWQHSVYLGMLLFLYFCYEATVGDRRGELWPQWIYQLGLIGALGAALAMVQIIPCYELGKESIRAYVNYWEVSAGNNPRFLWTLVVPNFLGGLNGFPLRYPYDLTYHYVFLTVPGTLLAVWGIVESVRRRNYFWTFVVLLFTTLALGNQGPLSGLVYRTPVLNLFRTSGAYFEIGNLALCFLAAIGAQSLLAGYLPPFWKRVVLTGLAVLLLAVAGAVAVSPGTASIPSWNHAIIALALFFGIVFLRLRKLLAARPAMCAVLALIAFDLWFYNSNQIFNTTSENPETFLSTDYAVGRKETIQYLRSDASNDFRVSALAEYQWTGNGWNVWRIPGITGVNPVALRRYYRFTGIFSHVLNVRLPTGGQDHTTDSPLADLLGVKYLVLANPEREAALGLGTGGRFTNVFEDNGWWRVYRNEQYFRHAWFYPKAYVLPGEQEIFDLLSSPWFDPRRVMLMEKSLAPKIEGQTLEELPAVPIFPGSGLEVWGGRRMTDPYCAQPVPMIGGWGARGSELHFAVPSNASPGRYRLLMRYTANELQVSSMGLDILSRENSWYNTALPAMPRAHATLEGGGGVVQAAPVSLPRTFGWPCHEARSVDLGEFAIGPGASRITIAPLEETALNVYSVSLVKVPEQLATESASFAFRNFEVSENRMEFEAELGEDGFVLLNEVYYPGWEATADGQPIRIIPADGVFRALYLTAGTHRIEFVFRPRYFYLGMFVSLLTATCMLVYFGVTWRRRRAAQ